MPTPAIPLLGGQAYHRLFFQGEGRSSGPLPSDDHPIEHFALHSRDDFRLKCKDTLKATGLDFYLIFIVTSGAGPHTFGAETHHVQEHMLCFVGPHLLPTWQTAVPDHEGYFCAFSEEFFNADRSNKGLLRSLPFFQTGSGASVLPLTPDQTQYFLNLMQHMKSGYLAQTADRFPLLRVQLQMLLQRAYLIYREAQPQAERAHSAGVRLTNAFLALLDEDLTVLRGNRPFRQRSVGDYARRLHVSQSYLNEVVRAHTGHSAGFLSQDVLAKTATTYLASSELAVAEIAGLLGFTSAAGFARFYRRHSGQSPTQAREVLQER